ncbi:MAG TPA: L,D-transpeptidase family protein [Rhizomicrobium sp.]|jgi:L,D-peptidoglycan transpeptidase YkuD (ErfK/YbiS/YcfS/YnhG family)|nr:L,D-transpeptidase family protein [Rhizomicrobium sp.]
MIFTVRPDAQLGAVLDWGNGARRCAVGRSGIAQKRSEGDGVTPIGEWPIRNVLYRADRIAPPKTSFDSRALTPNDGWCDAPADPNYNRLVRLPYDASHEEMWRQDRLYDIVAVLGFNDDPVIPGRGSAIFLHIARESYGPTEGCVALAMPDLLDVLRVATDPSVVRVTL